MSTYRSAVLVGVAALVFGAWEIVDHFFLMEMDMVAYHVIGFIAETALAVAAIFWASHNAAQARAERQRAERLAAVVVRTMVSADADVSPVASLVESLEQVREGSDDEIAIQQTLARIGRDARRIQAVNRGLERIVLPHIET